MLGSGERTECPPQGLPRVSCLYCTKHTYHLSFYISSRANQTQTLFQNEYIKKYKENNAAYLFLPKLRAKNLRQRGSFLQIQETKQNDCGALQLKTVENCKSFYSEIKERDNCHGRAKNEVVATVQNQISCSPGWDQLKSHKFAELSFAFLSKFGLSITFFKNHQFVSTDLKVDCTLYRRSGFLLQQLASSFAEAELSRAWPITRFTICFHILRLSLFDFEMADAVIDIVQRND